MLEPGQQPSDRSDIIVRVFHMKLEELLNDLRSGIVFGPINAILYSIEFQKRGLPHVHILLWLSKNEVDITCDIIDSFISAEIPDPNVDPLGYILIAEHMMHGPCGNMNINCSLIVGTYVIKMHFGDYLDMKFIIIHQLLKDCLYIYLS
uniref:Helitron helicase-like domain-containing protein n=1 Tax=Arundo donax TaxID=35708 RepID=A0A0A9HN84_ARUDO